MKGAATEPQVIRVFADYGASTPLWSAGLIEDLSTLGISAELTERLLRLPVLFERAAGIPDTGEGADEGARAEYEAMLSQVVPDLAAELGPGYIVRRG